MMLKLHFLSHWVKRLSHCVTIMLRAFSPLNIFYFIIYRKGFISLVKFKYFQLGSNINTFSHGSIGN